MPARDHIRKFRQQRKMSLEDLSNALAPYLPGLSKGDLSYIENGKRKVDADEIPVFAKVLNCRREELLDPIPGDSDTDKVD